MRRIRQCQNCRKATSKNAALAEAKLALMLRFFSYIVLSLVVSPACSAGCSKPLSFDKCVSRFIQLRQPPPPSGCYHDQSPSQLGRQGNQPHRIPALRRLHRPVRKTRMARTRIRHDAQSANASEGTLRQHRGVCPFSVDLHPATTRPRRSDALLGPAVYANTGHHTLRAQLIAAAASAVIAGPINAVPKSPYIQVSALCADFTIMRRGISGANKRAKCAFFAICDSWLH